MTNSKYGKYIITELKQNIKEAPWTGPVEPLSNDVGGRILFLDSEIVPGAFYVETAWSFPRVMTKPTKTVAEPHTHDFDEVLCMFGTDMNDPYKLNGKVEFWLGGEKHIITKSCIIFIPKGLQHCPLIYHKVDKPIFNFTTHKGKMYY